MSMTGTIKKEKQIGKIQFNLQDEDSSFLYGREFELSQLLGSYSRLTQTSASSTANINDEAQAVTAVAGKSKSELVLIGGYAGIGKSSLVRAFQKEISKGQSRPYFLSGKADELLSAEPCSSLVDAVSAWCGEVLDPAVTPQEEVSLLRQAIQDSVGDEGKLLTDLIPALTKLLGKQPELDIATDHLSQRNRLKNVLGGFIQAISRDQERPVILFLDDLQWADPVTLELISFVATNPSIQHFMLIGTYRDTEVDDTHILTKTLNTIRRQGKAFVTLSLGNLTLPDVNHMVARALDIDMENWLADWVVQDLAKVLFTKTQGNPLYVQNSLLMLERKHILTYSFVQLKWTWDMERVAEALSVADNVVATILDNLSALEPELQHVLAVASVLRSTFHVEILLGVLQKLQLTSPKLTKKDLVDSLDVAVRDGMLINSIGSPRYKFAHDRIQQACKMLVPIDQRHVYGLAVGKFILDKKSNIQDHITMTEGLFLAVDLFNALPLRFVAQELEMTQLVEWNLDVAILTCRVSAFAAALKYLQTAIEVVETQVEDRWEQYYDLCLRLYNTASYVEFTVGTFEKAKGYNDQVIEHAKNYDDKLPAYQSLSEGLGQRQRHSDALAIDKEVLVSVGQAKLHSNVFNVMWKLGKVKKQLAGISDDEILALPIATDPKLIIAMDTLSKMSTRAFYCNKIFQSLMCTIRQINLTLEHGLTQAAAFAIAGYGNICYMALGEYDLANRMVSLSYKIAKVTKARQYEAKVLFTTTNFVKSWQTPLPKLTDAFNRGYHAGIAAGDMEFACLSHLAYTIHFSLAGLPLATALDDCEELESLVKHYDVDSVAVILTPFQNLLMSLAGKQKQPLKYYTETIKFPKTPSAVSKSFTLKLLSAALYGMQTAYFFNDMEVADRLRTELDKYKDAEPTFSCMSQCMMFSSLISTALYRQSGNRKHLKVSERARKQAKNLMSKKGINLLHKFKIMEADWNATLPKKKLAEDIKRGYDDAIATAGRSGFMQDAALANELCGEYHIGTSDDFWAKYYLTKAIELYKSWGAEGKVRLLIESRGDYIEDAGSGVDGRKMKSIRTSRCGMTKRTMERLNDVNPNSSQLHVDDGSSKNFMESTSFNDTVVGSTDSSAFSLAKLEGSSDESSRSSSALGASNSAASTLTSGLSTYQGPTGNPLLVVNVKS